MNVYVPLNKLIKLNNDDTGHYNHFIRIYSDSYDDLYNLIEDNDMKICTYCHIISYNTIKLLFPLQNKYPTIVSIEELKLIDSNKAKYIVNDDSGYYLDIPYISLMNKYVDYKHIRIESKNVNFKYYFLL